MTANNTYGQKIGSGVLNATKMLVAGVVLVFLFAVGWIAWGGKKVCEGAEYATEQGKAWAADKAATNAGKAGNDIREAYNLYRQPADEQNTDSNANSVELENKVEQCKFSPDAEPYGNRMKVYTFYKSINFLDN